MTQNEQMISLFIAAAVVASIFIGMRSLWREWRLCWDLEDYVREIVAENADVVEVEHEHPINMPRRPSCLGMLGWHR